MGKAILTADLCILGGGAAGLSAAAGAAQLGASVVLVEGRALGGDCLHTGCVPSKALLAAAAQVRAMRNAARFGIRCSDPQVDFAAVMERVRQTQGVLGQHDGQARFERLGVTVVYGWGRFASPRHLTVVGSDAEAPEITITFRRACIATGSRPLWPWETCLPDGDRLLTTDHLFALTQLPEELLIVGGGAVGCEMAQAFCRLGARVRLIAPRLLPGEDQDLVALYADQMQREGIDLVLGGRVEHVARAGDRVSVRTSDGRVWSSSHLLAAVGRSPQSDALNCPAAGVDLDANGHPRHDGALRTTNRRIYLAGDLAQAGDLTPGGRRGEGGGAGFLSHLAGAHAGVVLRRALFGLPGSVPQAVPRVIYGSPELAQVGMTAAQARAQGKVVEVIDVPMDDLGRNRTDQAEPCGALTRVVIARQGWGKGRVLGVSLYGPQAGELIALWTAVVAGKMSLRAVAGLVVAYPTLMESVKHAAGAYYAPRLFSAWGRRLVRWALWVSDWGGYRR